MATSRAGLDVNRLRSDELEWELRARGYEVEATVERRRAQLRDALRHKLPLEVEFDPSPSEELKICGAKLDELVVGVQRFDRANKSNDYARLHARLLHVETRLNRVRSDDPQLKRRLEYLNFVLRTTCDALETALYLADVFVDPEGVPTYNRLDRPFQGFRTSTGGSGIPMASLIDFSSDDEEVSPKQTVSKLEQNVCVMSLTPGELGEALKRYEADQLAADQQRVCQQLSESLNRISVSAQKSGNVLKSLSADVSPEAQVSFPPDSTLSKPEAETYRTDAEQLRTSKVHYPPVAPQIGAPVLATSVLANHRPTAVSFSAHTVPVHKWDIQFNGSGSVVGFIESVELLAETRGVSREQLFHSIYELLRGDARDWYLPRRNTFQDWTDFAMRLREAFLPLHYEENLLDEIKRRTQGQDEAFLFFVTRMQNLFRKLGRQQPSEQAQIGILRRNLLPHLQTALAFQATASYEELLQKGKEAEQAHLQAQLYTPPPTQARLVRDEPHLAYGRGANARRTVTAAAMEPAEPIRGANRPSTCWSCGRGGHFAAQCRGVRPGLKCFRCGMDGVTVRTCTRCNHASRENRDRPIENQQRGNAPGNAQGFSVVAPELAVPGKTTAVLVTLHGPTSLQPLNVTLRLRPDASSSSAESGDGSGGGSQQRVVETTQEIRGHGILPLEVPLEATGSYVLQTLVNCSGNDQCELQSSSQMRLVGPVRDVIIRPAKHAYGPGETISFWVLALDHDLQIAQGAIGSVSVKDPAGTKVALWDQVPLDEGVKAFTLPLSEYVRSGRWLLHVEVESAEFSTPIEIAPGVGNGLPDVAAAEEHYVELRFGREMRRRYKPGLPFSGKVEAMSTEKSVRVRVKVYDNTTSIYSQDIEISNGEGTFVVPAILADSDIIALQAELVSVESKEIESHYVLAREPIHKWNSSSDCYLLIEGVEHTLQPEEEAHVTILSTCPCERDLHYVITTDGRVTDWAQRRYEDPMPSAASVSTGAVCRLNFSFTVRSVMAPVSQLLVYYVTSQGEPVSDVISFDVKLLHRQVYVNLEEREWWLPGQPLDLEVVAERSSLVCLLGGRSGGNGDIKFDPRISEEREPATVEGEVDFLEAGVSFFQRQCVRRGDTGISAVSYRQRGSGAGPASSKNRRRPPESLVGGAPFDQLWLWKCFNYSSEIASTGLTISAPQEAGKWSLWALTVSSTGGLRFSSSINVQVFRPLQAEFHLPPTLRIRETLEVDIKIGNNINSCMDVTALLALSEGAQFLSNGLLYVTERLRLGPHGATSLVVRLLVTTPGLKNMTVEVNGYTSPTCEGAEKPGNTSLAGAVLRSATILVYPEGIVRTDTESAYFCANENLVISTADKYKYEWMAAPRNHDGIILELKTGVSSKRIGPIHIALAESRSPSDKMYRLTIGDAENAISWIGRGKHGYGIQLARTETPGILSEDEWRTFWITWEKNTVAFGNGSIPHNNTLLKWRMDKKIKIQQIGFASSWSSLAEFRIWNFNEEAGFSQVLHLDTPKSVVPGSERGQLLVTGGLALPTVNNGRKIEGGGLSGALASLTPLLALQHLGKKVNETERSAALRSLPGNIQQILAYRKDDNSFSEHQMLGSHVATVSILEALTKVQTYFGIDPDLIQSIKRWVQLRQEDDGRFTPLPADVKLPRNSHSFAASRNRSSDLALLEHIVEITSDTVIALYDIEIENDADSDTLQKAKIFLENTLPKLESPEAIAAVALALVLVKSATSAWAIEKLRNISTTEDGEFGWPHVIQRRDAADWLYETQSGKTLKEPLAATLEEYKASLHALSAFCLIGDLKSAESVARYLFYRSHMLDRHPDLLYAAVKTFARYDSLAKDHNRALTVSLATSGMELTDTLELKAEKPTQELNLPSLPTKVFVYATGAGCATIQGKVTYSTYSVQPKTPLLELWSGVVQEILPDRSSVEEIEGKLPMLKLKTCFRWKGKTPSGVLRMEVSLFSGFELATAPPQLLSPPEDMAEMQHSSYANKLWFVFANISTPCPVCVQYMVRSVFVISSLRPAYAKIYPAGREDLAAESFFHTKSGSNLLKSITEDDLITWFGKNASWSLKPEFDLPDSCLAKEIATTSTTTETSTLAGSTVEVTSMSTPVPQKLEVLSVATYTINVDNTSISNDSNVEASSTDAASTISTISTSTMYPFTSTLEAVKTESDVMIEENIIPDVAVQTENVPKLTTSTESTKLIVDKNVSLPKHINTEVHELVAPTKKAQPDELPPPTFAPEMKNDRYVLLDKEELWGMLKEVVDDQLKKKTTSKIIDGQKLRSQGFT